MRLRGVNTHNFAREALNGNIRMRIHRGRGYTNLRYLLLKAKRMAATNIEFIVVRSAKQAA
jgi:hypothetical protein